VPRRIPIRTKLAAALAVPICALLLVSVLEVRESADSDRETRSQTGLATASIGPGGVITTLQNERNYGSVWLLGFEATLQLPVTSFDEAAAATDDAIETFRADLEDKAESVQRTYAPALDHIESELGGLRETVRTYTGPRDLSTQAVSDPFFGSYTTLMDELFQANGQAALAIDDPTLRRGVELTDLASHQIENVARLTRVLLLAGISGGLDEPTDVAEAAGLLGQVETGVDQIRELGTGRYQAAAAKVDEEFSASGFTELAQGAIESGEVQIVATMESLSREDDEGYNGFRTSVNTEISDRADDLNAESAATRLRYLTLGGIALLVAGLVTWLVSRSITRPLRSLTQQAKSMAEDRLPAAVTDILETPLGEDVSVPTVEPVRVNTRDEVSDVADALNTVQDSALDLAVEQAVLRRNIADSFVNLGRRNQNLLGRQLDFITELETNETNADTLSNLFRLDHLATRMRRNAESLLVLAGIEPPRQWAAPVSLTDVIRAALGEVEDYQRVTVRGVEPATIMGSAAADLAHLLAELVENALVFSPPDQTVDIRGRNRPGHGGDGIAPGYTLAIIDSGLGMPAGDIVAANRRLAGAESFTVAPSKYLGHYVAGNLAARHDIRVTLDNSPGNGVTATVDLPPALLTSDSELAAVPAPPGRESIGETGSFGVPALPLGAPRAAGAPPVDVPPAPAFDAAQLDALAPFGPPAAMPAPQAALDAPPPTRTASGLVKRSRRGAETAPAAAIPDGELLASLSSITNNLPRRSPQVPPAPTAPAAREATRPTNPWTPPPHHERQVTNRSWPAPPDLGRPGATPGDTGRPPLPNRSGNGAPGGRGPGGPAPADAAGGATASGLARRVRGAQLPATQPLNLRRRQDHPSDPPAGYRHHDHDDASGHTLGNGNTNGHTNGLANGHDRGRAPVDPAASGDRASNAATSVYGFLTSFTQGVQRGLDEARRDPNGPKENP
jgi:signal transduction histidine kinase